MSNTITPLVQQYTVDFASNNNFLFVKGIQGDGHSTRYVDISLMNNGQPYTVNSEAVTVVIRGTKPDTSIVFNECQILDNNTIRVEITQQMSAVAGRGNYEISIMSNTENRTLTSFPFFIIISKSSFDIGYVVSSNEFGLLIDKINQVHKIEADLSDLKSDMQNTIKDCENATDDCIDATDKAKKAINDMNVLHNNVTTAEAQRISNENDRIAAETQRNNAEQIRINNESVRITNENTRINNENDRKNAELERENSEILRNTAEDEREDAEAIRKANEIVRQNQENERQTNTVDAISRTETAIINTNTQANYAKEQGDYAKEQGDKASTSANAADDIKNELIMMRDNGAFKGDKGEPGRDGVITTVSIDQFAFEIIDGHLIMTYETGNTNAQKFSMDDNGHLIYTFTA